MRPWWVLIVLAGCFGPPPVPGDAVTHSDPALDGLELSAWTEMHGQRLRFQGMLANHGDQSYEIRVGCGQPWNSTLLDANSTAVAYEEIMEDPKCPVLWDILRPAAHLEFLHSWDFRSHDLEQDVHAAVPAGNYTWILQASLRDRPEVLETRLTVPVG